MSLITVANLQAITDHYGWLYTQCASAAGLLANQSSPTTATWQDVMKRIQTYIEATLDDIDQQLALGDHVRTALGKVNVSKMLGILTPCLTDIDAHMADKGPATDSSIVSLNTYLAYYNGGSGGLIHSSMLTPDFATLWTAVSGLTALSAAGVMSPCLHPTWNSGVSANGMGTRAVGGSFTDGAAVNTTLYSAVTLCAEVTTTFTNGGSPPAITVAGTDHTGGTSVTWTGTFSGNNPATAVSTTITPSITAASRQTLIAVGSSTGIVAGSVLTVNSGLVDQEVIVVEAVGTNQITAVFQKAHDAGAALTGKTTIALTPSTSARRCRDVSGITLTIDGHDAGAVRVFGRQDRVAL